MAVTINGIMGNVLQNGTQSTTITPTSPNIRTTSDFRFYEDAGLNDVTDGTDSSDTPKPKGKKTDWGYWVIGVLLLVGLGYGFYYFTIKKK